VDAVLAAGRSEAPVSSAGAAFAVPAPRYHQDLDDYFALAWN
jgi:hypothetical protein